VALVRIAHFGDVVGSAGRRAFAHACRFARADLGADVVTVNGENARHGRGLHPVGYEELRRGGADGVTLGDHYDDDPRILPFLRDPGEPLCAPVNYVESATGYNPGVRIEGGGDGAWVLWTIVVQGRLFMRREVTCPFEALDRSVESIIERDPGAMVIVEAHAEATSEKGGLAYHAAFNWPGRVIGVVGSHTHVQTSDARILEGATAAITDLGMCGASAGIIGFDAARSVESLRGTRGGLRIAEGEPVATGVLIEADAGTRRAVAVEPLRIALPAEDDAVG